MSADTSLPIEARAFLDALAVGESGKGENYNILFGGDRFTDYSKFPPWPGLVFAGGPTHAAGRYQFEPRTWAWVAEQIHALDFSPVWQDRAAWWLAAHVYKGNNGYMLGDDLRDNELDNVALLLKSTWTSLDSTSFPQRYRDALSEIKIAQPIPAPPKTLWQRIIGSL